VRHPNCVYFLAVSAWLGVYPAWAGNDALAQTQAVPAGERVAGYLQTMLTAVGQLMAFKHSGGISAEKYQPTVLYDQKNKAIQVSLVGTYTDLKLVKALVDFTREEVLNFNKNLQGDFGVTLADGDLEIDYLNVSSNKTLLSYKDGQYSRKFAPEPSPEPEQKEIFGPPGGSINGNP
jgi:hypothetical protein